MAKRLPLCFRSIEVSVCERPVHRPQRLHPVWPRPLDELIRLERLDLRPSWFIPERTCALPHSGPAQFDGGSAPSRHLARGGRPVIISNNQLTKTTVSS